MGIHSRLKSLYLDLGRSVHDSRLFEYKWFVEHEIDTWKHWVELPLGRRLALWRRGFTSPCARLYDFETYGFEPYLSELDMYRLYRSINGNHRYLIDDKLSQHWMLSAYPEHRPTAYGLVDDGHVHSVGSGNLEDGPVPVEDWLPSALRTHSKLVLKQLRGEGGNEVLVCGYDDGFTLDGRTVSAAALCEEVSGLSGYLVTEFVDQHAAADALYPGSTNTIRLLTLWDGRADELLVPAAIHRIGTARSAPVDNFSAGGLTAPIDLATGELGAATRKPRSGELRWYSRHPDTGDPIEGERVPQWETVLSTVRKLARENTHVPALGWDVLVDESGTPVVLEANTGTDVDLVQVHEPLLADERVERVVSRHV